MRLSGRYRVRRTRDSGEASASAARNTRVSEKILAVSAKVIGYSRFRPGRSFIISPCQAWSKFMSHGGHRIEGPVEITENTALSRKGQMGAVGAAHFSVSRQNINPVPGKGLPGKITHLSRQGCEHPGDEIRHIFPCPGFGVLSHRGEKIVPGQLFQDPASGPSPENNA